MNEPAKIRPSARLLHTIGKDLIKDTYSALVELVKNSYDADSDVVDIKFFYDKEAQRLTISVIDFGHGMSYETVKNVWLVPATDSKKALVESPSGRIMQGKKGIGRFAASILGDRILLETVKDGVVSSLILDNEEIKKFQYLDEINVEINSSVTNDNNGTKIIIEVDNLTEENLYKLWPEDQLKKLVRELRTLLTPKEVQIQASENNFGTLSDDLSISLEVIGFQYRNDWEEYQIIEPYPIYDLYDYRISGTVLENGCISAVFKNKKIEAAEESLKFDSDLKNNASSPGEIYFDIRMYERDTESLSDTIGKGRALNVFDETNNVKWIRKTLDELYGISLYRGGFRVRPYGDQDYDWLGIDKRRTQNNKQIGGYNQMIGFVLVENEHKSALVEKSARDGLVENSSYYGLKESLLKVLFKLQERVSFYKKSIDSSPDKTIDQRIDDLFDLSSFEHSLDDNIRRLGLDDSLTSKVEDIVGKVVEKEKKKKKEEASKIKEQLALYEGQATLGRVCHVLLHEGRKNVKFLSESSPRVKRWIFELVRNKKYDLAKKIMDRSDELEEHSKRLSYLFRKIEPLARTRREMKKSHNLVSVLKNALSIYEKDIEFNNIDVLVSSELEGINVYGVKVDLMTIAYNLIENSLYWMSVSESAVGKINITLFERLDNSSNSIVVEFLDNGLGFRDSDLSQIFDAGYSNKFDDRGTGLGLTIAGESASRFEGGKIEAVASSEGACFHVTLPTK